MLVLAEHSKGIGHAITIIGYDSNYYYYFENEKDSFIKLLMNNYINYLHDSIGLVKDFDDFVDLFGFNSLNLYENLKDFNYTKCQLALIPLLTDKSKYKNISKIKIDAIFKFIGHFDIIEFDYDKHLQLNNSYFDKYVYPNINFSKKLKECSDRLECIDGNKVYKNGTKRIDVNKSLKIIEQRKDMEIKND